MRPSTRGFTLVEMLIGLVLLAIVSTTIYRILDTNTRLSRAQTETVGIRQDRRTGDRRPDQDFNAADFPGAFLEQHAAHFGIRKHAERIFRIRQRFENQLG